MNVELAFAALEAAKAHPEQTDMTSWFGEGDPFAIGTDRTPPCGTTACYAGWVTLLVAPAGTVVEDYATLYQDGARLGRVGSYAARALGISMEQSWALFEMRSIGAVERALHYLADNPDASPISLRGFDDDDDD